ncbi:MAG: serine hydrolase domain-containing protein [Sphingomicrobium sp.]
MRSSIFLAAAVIAAPAAAFPADFKAQADSIVAKAIKADEPGMAIIVTQHGKTVYQAGRGLADLDKKTAITPDTVFRLGSITKQFTSSAILKLVEQGKISLDDPLTKFLPDYPQPGGAATVRQLLNHSSGIMPYTAIPGFMTEGKTGRSYTTTELIATFKDHPVQFKPGEKWEYNNSGYILLGAILEKVTGKSWDAAVHDLIVGPLKLNTIRSGISEDATPNMAKGYTRRDDKVAPSTKIHMSVPQGAGALIGTVGDLARWADALHHGKVISAASYAAMTGATKTADGQTNPYGFGMGTSDIRGHKTIGHSGGIFGFSTDSTYLPDEDIFVAVFANSDDGPSPGMIMRRVVAAALGDPYDEFTAQPVDKAAVSPLLGVYDLAVGDRRFFERDGKLYTRRSGGGELEVYPAGGNRFFYGPENLTWFEIVTAGDGSKTMLMHQEGATTGEPAKRSGPVPAEKPAFVVPDSMLSAYLGSYKSPLGTFIIARDGDSLSAKLEQQNALKLKPITLDEFEVERVGAKIRFGTIVGGKAPGLTMFQGGQQVEAKRTD